ncbi:MAG: Arc family DNA-binding protein [Rhizobiales bacterium]|nr:Arc family DNA-binding protein [Hyphomicrobiales bacterium]
MSQKLGSSEAGSSVAVSVRMPKAVRDSLQISAEKSRRSMNSEIVFLLEGALAGKTEAETAATVSAS